MGWIGKLFGFEQLPEESVLAREELPVSRLEDWLSAKEKELFSTNNLGVGATEYAQSLGRMVSAIEQITEDWTGQSMSLLRGKQYGVFFARLRQFIDSIDIPSQLTLQSVLQLHAEAQEKFLSFQNWMEENKMVSLLQDGGSLGVLLLQELQHLQETLASFQQRVSNGGLAEMALLRQKGVELQQYAGKLHELQRDLAAKTERLASDQARKEQKEAELSALEEGAHYSTWKQIKHRREQILAQQQEIEEGVTTLFTSLRQGLQDLSRREILNPIVEDYVQSPAKALLLDSSLSIIPILMKLKVALQNGWTSLTPEASSALLPVLERGKNALPQQREHFLFLQSQLKEVQGSLQHSGFLLKMEEARFRYDHFSQQVGKLEQEVASLKAAIEECNSCLLREKEVFEHVGGKVWGTSFIVTI